MKFESTQNFDPVEKAENALQEAAENLRKTGVEAGDIDFSNMDNLTPEQKEAAREYMQAFQKLEKAKAESPKKAA